MAGPKAPAPAAKPPGDDAAKGGNAAAGAFSKALGAANKFAGGIKSLGAASRTIASGALPSASSAAHSFGQAVGGVATDAADALAGALSKLGPEGQAAGAAIQAAAAVFSATVGVLADLAGIAVEVTQKMDLMRDRFAALAGSAAGGKAVQGEIAKLAATLPFASSQVSAWAQSLLAAGLQGKQLEESIKAIAAAQALMGDSGGAAAEKLIKQLAEGGAGADKLVKSLQQGGGKTNRLLAEMGLHTSDLAAALGVTEAEFAKMKLSAGQLNNAITKALQKKGKGPLEDMALTLPSILQKAREGFLSLFSGLGPDVKSFMKEIKSLFGEFNKGSPLVKALKPIVTGVFGVLFSVAKTVVKVIHGAFKSMLPAIQAVAKFMQPGIAAFKKWISSASGMKAIKNIIMGIVVVVAALAAPFVVVGAIIAAFVVGLIEVVAAIAYVIGAIVSFASDALGALAGWASGAVDAASNFISGLVSGISSGAGAVIDAVKNLASSALGAFKSVLGIASPSKVMAKMGGFAAEGAAQGLDQGAGKVQDSAAALGEGVKGGAAKGMAKAGGGKGKGGITINGGVHIEVPHGTPSAWAEEAFAAFMERLAASQGAT